MYGFDNKTVLITGGTGLIGSNLVDRLMKSRISKLIVTGRNKQKLETTFPDYLGNGVFEIIEHDASTPYPEEVKDVDFIFHAAGPMERNVVMNYPVSVIKPNILGTINALEYLKKQEQETGKKGRAIIFSSVTVYNNPTKEDFVAVEDETSFAQSIEAPTACYSESKRMSEVIAKSYVRQYGVDVVIARFSTVYGPTRNIPDTAFYEFVKKSINGENIIVNSNTAPRRDNIYVDDAIEGIVMLTLHGKTGESYNISSNGDLGNYAAVDEIAKLSAKAAGGQSKISYNTMMTSSKAGLKLDNSKLKQIGWQIHYSMEDGILNTINAIKKMGKLK